MQFQLLPASLALLLFSPQILLVSADVSTITQTAVATATPTSSQYTSDSDFQSALLTAHNFFRDEHNASALTWNDTSASYGANWANGCAFHHSVSSWLNYRLVFCLSLRIELYFTECNDQNYEIVKTDYELSRVDLQARISRQAMPMLLLLLTHGRLSGKCMTSVIQGSVRVRGISHRWCGRRRRVWGVGGLIVKAKMVSTPLLATSMGLVRIASGLCWLRQDEGKFDVYVENIESMS